VAVRWSWIGTATAAATPSARVVRVVHLGRPDDLSFTTAFSFVCRGQNVGARERQKEAGVPRTRPRN
jgi:hypothetical protein